MKADRLIELARESGLTVVLDGQIGREKYQSVSGPLDALSRFADRCRACEAAAGGEPTFEDAEHY
ncbi:hypothetical protein [Burkholderia cepacia]|uniref:hypothetical protein n=1 Tax=Burkholderia cepacia TaxID=292 RepID=UPI002AB6EDEC|nr:hypothetical protein [Burkholderia cepacia]